MNQVFRINATNRNIALVGAWAKVSNDTAWVCAGQSLNSACQFFVMFRGTSIKIYGSSLSSTNEPLTLNLDGNFTNIPLSNGTTQSGGATPLYRADNLKDVDHQLVGYIPPLANGSFVLDHLEIENSSGDIFNLLSTGPTAQTVPAQAVTVDDTSSEIIYHNESDWTHLLSGIYYHQRSSAYTRVIGSSLSYSFDGVAIWYYGSIGTSGGSFNVSIDDSIPQRLNTTGDLTLDQQLIWSNTGLGPGRHTITITLTRDDTNLFNELNLDFFRVLPGEGTSTLLSSFTTTNFGASPTDAQLVGATNQTQTKVVALAVGLTLGLLALVIVVLGSIYYLYRRKGLKQLYFDAYRVPPYTAPPTRQIDQQSSLPQIDKRPPQSARPPGTPMTTGDPDISSNVSWLGPPPSYRPMSDWRADPEQ